MTDDGGGKGARRLRRRGGLSLLLVVLVAATLLKPKSKPAKYMKLVPGRETTFLTEPAREDGTIDYAKALFAEAAVGVTAENNAAPLLARALGREPEWLTVPTVPTMPTMIVEFERGETAGRDATAVRAWLASIEPALELAAEAAKRDRCFVPPAGALFDRTLLAPLRESLPLAFALRACIRSADGARDAALADLQVALRFSRLLARPGSLVDAAGRESSARAALRGILGCARQRGAIAAGALADVAATLDRPPLDETLRQGLFGWRIEALDRMCAAYRGDAVETAPFARARERANDAKGFGGLDPNRVLRRFNAQWDRVEAALLDAAEPWEERAERLAALRVEIERTAREGEPSRKERPLPWIASRDEQADQIADEATARWIGLIGEALVAWLEAVVAVDRAVAIIAALDFSAETGRDPASTDELAPAVFAAPFRDRLLGGPLQFRRAADGPLEAFGPPDELVERVSRVVDPKPAK